jgi:hypothetical protein
VGDSRLQEAVCIQRPELWPLVGYMKLCVDRGPNWGDSRLHEALCRQRPELWVIVGYMKLCVDRDLNCG